MTSFSPSQLTASYPTTASLIALFSADGIQTGFGCFATVAGGGQLPPGQDPDMFLSSAAFFAALVDKGFFTGGYPKLYYTPAAAASLMAAPTVVYNGYTINQIEYRMRTEGVTSGCFGVGSVVHAAGEDPCTILEALGTDGYVSGSPETISPIDGGFSDYECLDGRTYKSGCLNPWTRMVTGIAGAINFGWTLLPAKGFSATFATDVKIIFMGSTIGLSGFRFYVDGVLISGSGGLEETTHWPNGNVYLFSLAAGTHAFTFEYIHNGLCAWPGCSTQGTAIFIAYRED